MRKKKSIVVPKEKSYKILDRRGQPVASSLYPSPNTNGNWNKYRPRLTVVGDTKNVQTAYDRLSQIRFARGLFASMTDLGGAILAKSQWCVGDAFSPGYTGGDKKWGDEAETWLSEVFYPTCNVLGPNFDFRTTLTLSSLSIDVDGDSALILTTSRSGYPQVMLVASHRIAQRDSSKIVTTGKFAGYDIADGCIFNDVGRCIGYRILGDTVDADVDISSANLQNLYEPEWSDQAGHGISRIARSTLDWMDMEDISTYTKRGLKIASAIGLIHSTETGTPDTSAAFVGAIEDASGAAVVPNDLQLEYIKGGEVYYLHAGAGEDIKSMTDERPSQNSSEFMDRIQRKALYSIGWPVELLNASAVGGASVRLVQDLARKSIASRQITLQKRAKWVVNFAIAKAMNAGFIPQNNVDWYSWSFTKPGLLSVDNGYELQADREGFKLGMNTLSEISAKKGADWWNIREQQMVETEDLLERATNLSTKYNITVSAALNLLSQRSPNASPVVEPVAEPVAATKK